MTDSATDANVGTTPVRQGFELNASNLETWLSRNVQGYTGPLTIEQFKGGQSNPTYKIVSPSGNYVLRRQPPGTLLKGAHAVDREAAIQIGLSKVGFPVPRIYGLCTDDAVIGSMFYVMEMIDGRIFWDATLPEVHCADRRAYYDAMNATISSLHCVNYQAIGLSEYGKSGNYFSRQVARWSRQYRDDLAAGRDANMDDLVDWLESNLPDGDETSIVHGDFRIDNMIFHPTEPVVIAVLDWELSTLGHPLADFAYNAMMYRMPPDIVAGLADADLGALGLPTEAAYIAAYCRRTGRQEIANYPFYLAFNFFRLAAIFHGIKGRVIRGTASSASAHERAEAFPRLAQIGWSIAQST
jgi:aminoglycoside phosphotransferase (APT) family kinase protein